jgi:hypothetical protein
VAREGLRGDLSKRRKKRKENESAWFEYMAKSLLIAGLGSAEASGRPYTTPRLLECYFGLTGGNVALNHL